MDWMHAVFRGFEFSWFFLGLGSLGLALLFMLKPAACDGLAGWIESRSAGEAGLVLGLAASAGIALFKLAQFHSYQLMLDSGIMANEVWNVAHGYGFVSSAFAGKSPFANHFAFTQQLLLAPLLRLWDSTAALAVAQGVALGSSTIGVYRLTRISLEEPLAPWLMVLLFMSQHFFHDLIGAVLDDSVYALPFFVWGAYFWETNRGVAAALFGALLLTTREAVPFIFFGIGLYLLTRSKGRKPEAGMALMICSAAGWLIEMKVVSMAQAGWHQEHWGTFQSLGDSREAILRLAMHQPWKLGLALVYPPLKLWTVAKVFLSMSLLPLGAGAAIWPALAAWAPHQLADAGSAYHDMNAHACAFVFGPLILASIKGLKRAFQRLSRRRYRRVAACVLTVSGILFLNNANFLLPPSLIPSAWKESAPKALAQIPKEAKVWCDPFFLPHLGLRRYVKFLPRKLPDPWFEPGLFLPDRVLLSQYWIERADPPSRDRLLRFLSKERLRIVFQEKDLIVLAGSSRPVRQISIP